ncbi:uracil-DNA glycosylase family protein [Sorangium sp. So ce834]|uniref:uracil-DNA glycosylase family protein n=1 Tax=Sorangium sp. So ce834 TaxID=3133321 RepID=UPI003F5FBB19
MVVTLNPGAPMDGERDLYASWGLTVPGCVSENQAKLLMAHCTKQYVAPGRGADTVFHRKITTFARASLWVLGHRDAVSADGWIDNCWFTDIFKCSTRAESAPRIPKAAFAACRPHLEAELAAFAPRVLLAFGATAAREVASLRNQQHSPAIFTLPFPVNAGLAAVTDTKHDALFHQIALLAGVGWTEQIHREFAAYRAALLARYFP